MFSFLSNTANGLVNCVDEVHLVGNLQQDHCLVGGVLQRDPGKAGVKHYSKDTKSFNRK